MNIFDMYETDAELETKGIDYDMAKAGIFVLARAGGANLAYAKAIELKTRPYRNRSGGLKKIDDDVAAGLLRDAFAETVILGWRGVKGRDGKELKWSKEAAVKLMEDLPELYKELSEEAGDMANYQAEAIETDVKN